MARSSFYFLRGRIEQDLIETLWISFAVILFIDLLLIAMRSCLLNVRQPILLTMHDQHPHEVDRVMMLIEKMRLRVMIRLSVVLAHSLLLGVSAWLFLLFTSPILSLSLALLFLALAALVLLIIEFAIEGLILPKAEVWAIRLSGLAQMLDWLLSPLSSLLTRLLGAPASLENRLNPVTENELKSWVEEPQPEGSLEQGERRMIYSIFHFGDTLAREIMVPRIDILALDVNSTLDEVITALNNSGHSRLPVYEESIDRVIGMLYAKDLLRVRQEGKTTISNMRSLLRPAYFVPETKKVDELLREMQARSVHMALVVDEYGGIAGLVTLEDIVEEIVGEIRDEYDQKEEQLYEKVSDDEYVFHGQISLDDFNRLMGSQLPTDVADTLGGYIYSQIGRVPVGGERIEVDSLVLTVEQVSGRRIRRVRALRRSTIPETEERTDDSETER